MARKSALPGLELIGKIKPRYTAATVRPTASGKLVVNLDFNGNELWDAAGQKRLVAYTHPKGVCCWLAVPTLDESGLFTAYGDGTVCLYKIQGPVAWQAANEDRIVTSLDVADDSVTAVTGDHKVTRFWNLRTGKETARFAPKRSGTAQVAISPQGTIAATGANDKFVHLVEVATGKEIAALAGHEKPIQRLAFTRDGRHVVSCSGDGTVRLWDVGSHQQTLCVEVSKRPVRGLAVAPDSRFIVAGGSDKRVRVIDIKTAAVVLETEELDDIVADFSISPDGQTGYACIEGLQESICVWRMP